MSGKINRSSTATAWPPMKTPSAGNVAFGQGIPIDPASFQIPNDMQEIYIFEEHLLEL